MEITDQNMAVCFAGLSKAFLDAVNAVVVPETAELVEKGPASFTLTDDYPASGMLGDLEEILDEVAMTNIWQQFARAPLVPFGRAFAIKRAHILADELGLYQNAIKELAELTATHPYRRVPSLLLAGTTTPWLPEATTTGAMVFSDNHQWVGGQAWDNLDHLPLTVANFDTVCLHIEMRQGPGSTPLAPRSMGLVPKLLICGPLNRAAAEMIVTVQTIGGTNNRQYKRCDLRIYPEITDLQWGVVDNRRKPILYAPTPEGARTAAQTAEEADSVFDREEYRFKGAISYKQTILAPHRIQWSDWTLADEASSTTAAV